MIGFYVLALGIAGALLWILYADVNSERINLRLVVFCVVSAGAILWSILPRPDRFEPPGPRVDPTQQPALFAELSRIAQSVQQELPHEVYFVPEVNAWVAQRGGVMAFGSRRVMVLGVPLMALLTVSQFRAVLAHEFGHYYGGDTKLGPWIYKTRAAIGRTLRQLARSNSWLVFLFKWYGNMFLEITLGISRAQEYAADRIAAQVAGKTALVEGLKQQHRGAVAWEAYLRGEVLPVLARGYSPPLAGGLAQFLQAPTINAQVQQSLDKELAGGEADSMDSHPALRERIAALPNLIGGISDDPRPATALLADFGKSDTSLFADPGGTKLMPVSWDRVLIDVYVPTWQEETDYQKDALRGMTMVDVPEQFSNGSLVQRLKNPPDMVADEPQRVDIARNVVGCALCLVLLKNGWTFHALPGEMYAEKDGQKVEPFTVVQKLDRRQLTVEQWKEICSRAEILNLPLYSESAHATATTDG